MSTHTPSAPPGAPRRTPRLRVTLILAAMLATIALVVWLFGPGATGPGAPAGLAAMERLDGTLVEVDSDRLVLRPFQPVDGAREVEDVAFRIRPEDSRQFDQAHLRSHSSIGLPTRLYFERVGGQRFAVYKDDAPVNDVGAR